jgi:hypothetical protein
MSREDAITTLKAVFDEYKERKLSDGQLLVQVGPLKIVGGHQKTKVAFRLPEQINSLPEVFVETHITLNTGGQPDNMVNVDIEGEPWKKWSFASPWNPESHSIDKLVYAVLSRFNR